MCASSCAAAAVAAAQSRPRSAPIVDRRHRAELPPPPRYIVIRVRVGECARGIYRRVHVCKEEEEEEYWYTSVWIDGGWWYPVSRGTRWTVFWHALRGVAETERSPERQRERVSLCNVLHRCRLLLLLLLL